MVATNSTAASEIQALFDQASEKARELASNIEKDEAEISDMLRALFLGRIKALVPLIKYIDKDLELDRGSGNDEYEKGIEITKGHLLSRNGRIYDRDLRVWWAPVDFPLGATVDEQDELVTYWGSVLTQALDNALEKSNERGLKLLSMRTRICQDTDRLNQQQQRV